MTKTTKTSTEKANSLLLELQSFMGDLVRHRHPLNRSVIYTPGVRHLAEKGEAYWLLDAIASWIGSPEFVKAAKQDPRVDEMHFWTLDVEDQLPF